MRNWPAESADTGRACLGASQLGRCLADYYGASLHQRGRPGAAIQAMHLQPLLPAWTGQAPAQPGNRTQLSQAAAHSCLHDYHQACALSIRVFSLVMESLYIPRALGDVLSVDDFRLIILNSLPWKYSQCPNVSCVLTVSLSSRNTFESRETSF